MGIKIAALVCALAVVGAFPVQALDPCGPGHMLEAKLRGGTLELQWVGKIVDQMSGDIAAEFDRYKRHTSTVVLSLHSCGGALLYMQRTIAVLEQIKGSHALTTLVARGGHCGSACVPVFLAGTRRVGALTSSFFFHPVVVDRSGVDPGTPAAKSYIQYRSEETDKIISRYFVPARVSDDWLQFLRRTLQAQDLWQSGRDLWESKSGMLTETLDNLAPREDGPIDLPNEMACGVLCRG